MMKSRLRSTSSNTAVTIERVRARTVEQVKLQEISKETSHHTTLYAVRSFCQYDFRCLAPVAVTWTANCDPATTLLRVYTYSRNVFPYYYALLVHRYDMTSRPSESLAMGNVRNRERYSKPLSERGHSFC